MILFNESDKGTETKTMNEHIHILLAKDGQKDAFKHLYGQYAEKLFRTAYRYTLTSQDAEDILQETFINALGNIKKFKPSSETSFYSWLFRICINCSLSHLRKNKRRKKDLEDSISLLTVEPPSPGDSPETFTLRQMDILKIRQSLSLLSPNQRIAFDLRYYQHMEIDEISRAMNCGKSSVKKHLSRAMDKLKTTLHPRKEDA